MAMPASLAPFNVTFEPDPEPGYQFTFTTATGAPLNNAFFVEEDGASVMITLTNPGATFSDSPLAWSIEPEGWSVTGAGTPTLTLSGIPIPTHLFQPWIFRIKVDVDGVNAIRSQNIYLVKNEALDDGSFFLKYSAADGNFSLVDSLTDSHQDGAILADVLALINTQIPSGLEPFLFTVILDTVDLPPDMPAPIFSPSPVIFSAYQEWLGAIRLTPGEVQFALYPGAVGQSISVQFSILVTNSLGQTATVLSPDPIIMNTTIGDG